MRRLPLALLLPLLPLLATGCPAKKDGGTNTCPAPVATTDDADADLLTDFQEIALGTNPDEADSDGDGYGDYVEVSAGTDPLAEASAPSGQVATVRQIENAADLIGGPAAQGRVGDWLLENDRIRAIVQAPGSQQMQVGKFGGNLIDADVIRSGDGADRVGSLTSVWALAATSNPTRAVVVNDGSDGGPAILRTCGEDAPFEYLDLEATVRAFGFNMAYDSNRDFDVHVSNDYVLAPGSNVVEVITTVVNHGSTFVAPVVTIVDSGGAEEVFLTNNQGFGQLSFSDLLSTQPPVRYLAFVGPDATWGYVGEAEPNAAINVYGITAIAPGFDSPLAILASDPDDGPGPGMLEFRKGKRTSWRRGIVITDGLQGTEPISAEYVRRHETGSLHTGTVADDGGPLAGVRVVALRRGGLYDRTSLSATLSDENGEYSFFLPDGDYYIAADIPGRAFPVYSFGETTFTTLRDEQLVRGAEVTLTNASALPDITFDPPTYLSVTVTDATSGLPVPAKVSVVGTDPSPSDSIFRDPKDRLPSAVATALNSASGSFLIPVEPGTYDVYASRGLEWSLDQAPVTVGSSGTVNVALSIGRVVDTPGWISGDFHVHMLNSPDSGVTLVDRVLSGVAEGLDVIVTTDHDFVTDLNPVIASLNLASQVASCSGDEISTTAFGHFIAFPLTRDPDSTTGGSYAWSGEAGALNARHPADMFADIAEAHPGSQVELVAHPRGDPLTAYYDAIGLSTLTLATTRDPLEVRIPRPDDYTEADTKLFYAGFDAQEVMNGATESDTRRNANLNDWFSLLSHGLSVAAIGDSDTHSVYAGQLGFPRTYVKVSNDAIPSFASVQEEFAVAVKDGKAFFTSGPILDVTVTGDDAGGPGALVRPRVADGMVTVMVRLEMPDWIEVDALRFYMNTPQTGAPSGSLVEAAPAPLAEYPIALVTTSAGAGLQKNVFTMSDDIAVPTTGDAWFVVVAATTSGTTRTLFPVVAQGSAAYALANPVFLDGNRNGTWNPPGNVTQGPLVESVTGSVRVYGPDELEANLPAVREQFRRLTAAGEHDH